MTLVTVAITTVYAYSGAVLFGLSGRGFFRELATLVDIMLLGHWIEMRSVMGELPANDKVLIRPGEKSRRTARFTHGMRCSHPSWVRHRWPQAR